jgi:hypothetical protein
MARIIDVRMHDGSRHFGSLPERYDVDAPEWHRVRDRAARLPGVSDQRFLTDDVTEAWIDFAWHGHAFSINNQAGAWWFFVTDPACPVAVLERVLAHFEPLLDPLAALARACGPLAPGHFRALVVEPDGRTTHHDFADRAAAHRHAADARHETEDDRGHPLAAVFDDAFGRG